MQKGKEERREFMEILLHYIGDGNCLLDVPARDLTADEVKVSNYTLKELIATGLYQRKQKAAEVETQSEPASEAEVQKN